MNDVVKVLSFLVIDYASFIIYFLCCPKTLKNQMNRIIISNKKMLSQKLKNLHDLNGRTTFW